jgi:hypothetical protein
MFTFSLPLPQINDFFRIKAFKNPLFLRQRVKMVTDQTGLPELSKFSTGHSFRPIRFFEMEHFIRELPALKFFIFNRKLKQRICFEKERIEFDADFKPRLPVTAISLM